MTPLTHPNHWKQNSKIGEGLCASTFKLDHVVRGEVVVQPRLGFGRGLAGDLAGACRLSFREQLKSNAGLDLGQDNIVHRDGRNSALGVKLCYALAKSLVKRARVILSHRAAALVIFTTAARQKDRSFAVAIHKFVKEQARALLCSIRDFRWHGRLPPVLISFLALPPRGSICGHNSAVKFHSRNYPKVSRDNQPPLEGRAA